MIDCHFWNVTKVLVGIFSEERRAKNSERQRKTDGSVVSSYTKPKEVIKMRRLLVALTVFNVVLLVVGFAVLAGQVAEAKESESEMVAVAKALGGGLAMLGGTLGTGMAQAKIGAAAIGATVESPSFFGTGLTYLALPETIVIMAFVSIFLI